MHPTIANIQFPTGKSHELQTGLFINNEFRASSDGKKLEIHNPSTAEVITSVFTASKADVDDAVKAARLAFKTTWGKKVAPTERGRLINKLADLFERDSQLIAEIESLNSGKGVRIARDSDIGDSIACLRYYAGWCDKIHGKTISVDDESKLIYTRAEPVGVCGQIIPWNYPLMMMAWKIAPALAAGCTIILKPSELTPLSALYMAGLVVEAGFPAGVLNILPGDGSTTGDAISRHMDIDKVAFTGSTVTGRKIMIAAAESNLKKVGLELGGKSPSIVFPTADLEQAAAWTCLGIFFNSGQDCTAGSRIAVHEKIYDSFMAELVKKAEACAIGLPHDEKTSFGPLISEPQFKKVLGYIESGKAEGAKILTGGGKPNKSVDPQGAGWFVTPTIFGDTKPGMKIHDEEIFGPVLCVRKFTDEDEVIEWANNTTYGLAASLHSNDAKQCIRVSNAIDAGTVWVNNNALLHNQAPFGGFKMSGNTRELGESGVNAYIENKTVMHYIGENLEWPL